MEFDQPTDGAEVESIARVQALKRHIQKLQSDNAALRSALEQTCTVLRACLDFAIEGSTRAVLSSTLDNAETLLAGEKVTHPAEAALSDLLTAVEPFIREGEGALEVTTAILTFTRDDYCVLLAAAAKARRVGVKK